ncbi:hypothetical protein [Streptomyces sp. NPDC001536]|uniref:hypothetical protein n=1 Tax=Streptomyces sp. NPDC001536 TaxID=3364583 RepID=UPI00367A19E2
MPRPLQDKKETLYVLVMMAVRLVAAALFGFGVLGPYDRKGLHRIPVGAAPEKTAVQD